MIYASEYITRTSIIVEVTCVRLFGEYSKYRTQTWVVNICIYTHTYIYNIHIYVYVNIGRSGQRETGKKI